MDYDNSESREQLATRLGMDAQAFHAWQQAENFEPYEPPKKRIKGRIEKIASDLAWDDFRQFYKDWEYDLIGVPRLGVSFHRESIRNIINRNFAGKNHITSMPQVFEKWYIFYFECFWDARLPARYRSEVFKNQTIVKAVQPKEIREAKKSHEQKHKADNFKAIFGDNTHGLNIVPEKSKPRILEFDLSRKLPKRERI